MGVGLEATTGANLVVIVNEEQAVTSVCRVVVGTEAERVPRVEPADVCAEARFGGMQVDGLIFVGHAQHNIVLLEIFPNGTK